MQAPLGRPSEFTDQVAATICERLANGESLRSICCDDEMPAQSTVFRWLADERFKAFQEQYTRAREAQADALFDEMLDIADDGSNDWMEKRDREDANIGWRENGEALRRSALRVDTRKWMAGKLKPKKYGDKTLLGSDPDNPLPSSALSDTELARVMVFHLTKSARQAD
jgi:hypothetical protein